MQYNHEHYMSQHSYLPFPVCYRGDIRLTGVGSNVTQGNVVLCKKNHFNAICGNVWSSNDAKVVCRQLGFNRSKFQIQYMHAIHLVTGEK